MATAKEKKFVSLETEALLGRISPSHQVFALHYALYANSHAAARAAYPSRTAKGCDAVGRRLRGSARVMEVVAAVRRDFLASICVVDKPTLIGELAKVAFANVLDFCVVRDDGSIELDMRHVDRATMAGVQEVVVTENETTHGTTRRVQVKLAPKLQALSLIGQVMGLVGTAAVSTPAVSDRQALAAPPDPLDGDVARRLREAVAAQPGAPKLPARH